MTTPRTEVDRLAAAAAHGYEPAPPPLTATQLLTSLAIAHGRSLNAEKAAWGAQHRRTT